MTDQPNPQDLMMQIYARNGGHGVQGPQMFNFDDPESIDWGALARSYGLDPQEVQQLQIPTPSGGPSLQQRLQALRPNVNLGGLNLSTDGRRVQGRMTF